MFLLTNACFQKYVAYQEQQQASLSNDDTITFCYKFFYPVLSSFASPGPLSGSVRQLFLRGRLFVSPPSSLSLQCQVYIHAYFLWKVSPGSNSFDQSRGGVHMAPTRKSLQHVCCLNISAAKKCNGISGRSKNYIETKKSNPSSCGSIMDIMKMTPHTALIAIPPNIYRDFSTRHRPGWQKTENFGGARKNESKFRTSF